jgi:hypothetical protein
MGSIYHVDSRGMCDIILILQFYVLEFPEKLKAYKGTNFEKYKDDELQNLKNEFDFIIGAKCNVKSTQYAFIQGVQLLETLCVTCTPLKIKGLSNVVVDNDFQDDVKHMALKYMTLVKTEPEARIAYKILSSMLLLHQVNTVKQDGSVKEEVPKPLDETKVNGINSKYSDL